VAEIKCANCGGSVQLEMEQDFVACRFCDSTLYVERSSSFQQFCFGYTVTEKRAESIFKDSMHKLGILKAPFLSIKRVILPFLSRHSDGREVTKAAFTPHPSFFEDFVIPSGTPLFFSKEAKEWGEFVIPDEEAFLFFEKTAGDPPSLYHIPFYEIAFGKTDNKIKAYVNAVTGKVFLESFPIASSEQEGKKLLLFFIAYFLLFSLVSALIKSIPAAFFLTLAVAALCSPLMADLVLRRFK
jgi:hypothetical protein